jgi:hypothetical protein
MTMVSATRASQALAVRLFIAPPRVRALDAQIRQQRRGVVGRLLETERPVDVGCVAVALLLERDDLSRPGERRQYMAERRLDGVAAAMQQHEWWLVQTRRSVDLVVQPETVDGGKSNLVRSHSILVMALHGRRSVDREVDCR